MTPEEKFKLITKNLEETLTEDELRPLLENFTPLRHYIGVEISGKIHLGYYLIMLKIKDLQQAGVLTSIFLADWHTWINHKLDSTLDTARRLAKQYFQHALKACALSAGADPEKIEFILGSDLYREHPDYWATVVQVSKATTLARMLRSTTIMGREVQEIIDSAMLIYPAMQAADIFTLGVNIAHSGTDQRNVHIVVRDAANALHKDKPIAIHHHLLLGLSKPPIWPLPKENREESMQALKMSKSKPDSAIFIHDSPGEIERKINSAFCPEGEIEYNPILDWVKHLIFYDQGTQLEVKRDSKFGGDMIYDSYDKLEQDFKEKNLHPHDLKKAVSLWLIKTLEPARIYFEDPERKKALEEIESLTQK